jgi:hypothetical protein
LKILNEIFYRAQRVLALFGLKIEFGPSASQVRQVAKLLAPQPSTKPLIRIGGATDGAYLLPNDLDGVGACFSPGVAESCSFELELAAKGIRSFLADFSVTAPPVDNSMFNFEKLYIGPTTDGEMYITLADWVESKIFDDSDLILQMDIEGSEWPVLESTPPSILRKFRIIVIELHDLDEMMSDVNNIKRVETVFRKLISDFVPVHLHANNCCKPLRFRGVDIPRVLEVTLIRKDRHSSLADRYPVNIPNPLDIRNVQNRKAIPLTSDWVE